MSAPGELAEDYLATRERWGSPNRLRSCPTSSATSKTPARRTSPTEAALRFATPAATAHPICGPIAFRSCGGFASYVHALEPTTEALPTNLLSA